MMGWLSGILSALMAWGANSLVVKKAGGSAVIWVVPVLEEGLKTGTALLLGTSVLLTHSVFGLGEALHDYLVSRRFGFWAGLSSIVSHWAFGQTTVIIHFHTMSWPLGVLTSIFLHICWNLGMVYLFTNLTCRGKQP